MKLLWVCQTDLSCSGYMNQMELLPFIEGYTYELVVADEIRKLYGIKGFDNSLSFDENGNTSTCIVLYAKKDIRILWHQQCFM